MWFFWIFFLILSLIVEVYLWWKLQASLIFLSGRTCTIGGWLNTFLPHCMFFPFWFFARFQCLVVCRVIFYLWKLCRGLIHLCCLSKLKHIWYIQTKNKLNVEFKKSKYWTGYWISWFVLIQTQIQKLLIWWSINYFGYIYEVMSILRYEKIISLSTVTLNSK